MKPVFVIVLAGIATCTFARSMPLAEAATFKEKVLWSFGNGSDGREPVVALIDIKGVLYGTTWVGGNSSCSFGCGTVFSFDPKTGAEKVLYYFDNTHGAWPQSGLIDVKGILYGTTSGGGTAGCTCGTVFSVNSSTGAETVVHSFQGSPDGMYAASGLLSVKDALYGTTVVGGENTVGTVFSIDSRTGAEQVLYSFCSLANCTDGAELWYGTPIYVNGTLYGTTSLGGHQELDGTVFSFDLGTGKEAVVHSFCLNSMECVDGGQPFNGLTNVNGTLYGTTQGGYDGGAGIAFAFGLNTGAYKILYSFCVRPNCSDGAGPNGLINVKGDLYGTAATGGDVNTTCGASGCGTVFSLDPNTGAETVLYTFQGGTDGENPEANLLDVNGALYGTTRGGGTYGYGTIFAIEKR